MLRHDRHPTRPIESQGQRSGTQRRARVDWPEAVGLNKGAQDTIVKPAMAPLIDAKRRSTAFGVFDTCFGSAWLVGSIALGLMYARDRLPR